MRDDAAAHPRDAHAYTYHKGCTHGLDDGRRMLLAVLDHLRWKEQTK